MSFEKPNISDSWITIGIHESLSEMSSPTGAAQLAKSTRPLQT